MKKQKGSVAILVVVFLLVILSISLFYLPTLGVNVQTAVMSIQKDQSKTAAQFALQKYLDYDKSKVISDTLLSTSGTMGENEKSKITWEFSNVSETIVLGSSGSGTGGKASLYSMYPFGSLNWTNIGEIDNKGNSLTASGLFNKQLNSELYHVTYLSDSENLLHQIQVQPEAVLSEDTIAMSGFNSKLSGSFAYWDNQLNATDSFLVTAIPGESSTHFIVYSGNLDIDKNMIKVYEGDMPYLVDNLTVSGYYSPEVNAGFLHITTQSVSEQTVRVLEFNPMTNALSEKLKLTGLNYYSLSSSSLWNSVYGTDEIYIAYLDKTNQYKIYRYKNNAGDYLPYSSSISVDDNSSNFGFTAVYDATYQSPFLYLVKLTNPDLKQFETYKYIPDTSSVWTKEGMNQLDYAGHVQLYGISSDKSSLLLINSSQSQSFTKKTSFTVTGKIYQKSGTLEILKSVTTLNIEAEIEYESTASGMKVKQVTVKSATPA